MQCAARRRHRGLARPERASRRGCLGPAHPPGNPRLRALHAHHLGAHGVPARGLLSARVGSRRSAHAHDVATPAVHRAGVHRRHGRHGGRRSGVLSARPMDTTTRRRDAARIRRAHPAAADTRRDGVVGSVGPARRTAGFADSGDRAFTDRSASSRGLGWRAVVAALGRRWPRARRHRGLPARRQAVGRTYCAGGTDNGGLADRRRERGAGVREVHRGAALR